MVPSIIFSTAMRTRLERAKLDDETRRMLGAALRSARKRAGLSLSEAADATEVGRTYIPQLEAGKRDPSLAMLIRFAAGFGTTVGAILRKAGIK